ncbi:FAD-binding oxidoreductase [Marinomonas algarum]|uniref:2Fe-2S iron-sulfur cluster binding domain-containing protein n=1 Tax=Marinomonas algarum TaxID=2883105 RepID=A0A9X1LFK1_9GAMM|nr:FAD-binding oxidoreductase [Marinomonas algarum]MCB5163031.1 2Fe-2S iron-sulfur cluster binding domain-containing protein [Marinomonas algarum]
MSTITVNPSGKVFESLEGETILDAALRSSIMLKHGCRDGRCGDCRTTLANPAPAGAISYPETLLLEASDRAGETVLCCQAVANQDLVLTAPEVTELEGISIQKLMSRVKSKEAISDDVMVLKLMFAPGSEFPYFPGQYIDITLPNKVSRSYSMASQTPQDNAVELHIRLKPDGEGTPYIFNELATRKMVTVEGPFGSFYLRKTKAPIIFIASGTGFAPIKAIMEQLIDLQGEANINARPVTLYWGGRSEQDLYMSDLCERWAKAFSWFKYIPVISDQKDNWSGRTGFVHRAVVEDYSALGSYEVYACGAPIVIESARRDLVNDCQLLPTNFYSDAFI